MCGIVLAGGNLTSNDLNVFNQLLYCGVFRGQHSTGVMYKRVNSLKGEVGVLKDSIPSHKFLESKEYKNIFKGAEVNTGKTTYVSSTNMNFIVGHNRHATVGSINSTNAHPFVNGNITLVHNGTITNKYLLPDYEKFKVDSDNICHSINKMGIEETIQVLDGSYALVWHDAKDDTLHILRNSERPFHLYSVASDWFGASEEAMISWIIGRSHSYKHRQIKHFECEAGKEYIFSLNKYSMTLEEEKSHVLPNFYPTSHLGGNYVSDWQKGSSRSSRKVNQNNSEMLQNAIAQKYGLSCRIDEIIDVSVSAFDPFPLSKDKGNVSGYYLMDDDYIEVSAYGVSQEVFDKLTDPDGPEHCKAKLMRIIENHNKKSVRFIVSILENSVDTYLTEEDDDTLIDLNEVIETKEGRKISRRFWESHSHSECGGCEEQIPWKEAKYAKYRYNAYWHEDCLDEELNKPKGAWGTVYNLELKKDTQVYIYQSTLDNMVKMIGSVSRKITLEDVPNAYIELRSDGKYAIKVTDKKGEPADKAGNFQEKSSSNIPTEDGTKIIESKDRTRFARFSRKQWKSAGVCKNCKRKIPWFDAELCSINSEWEVICVQEICNRGD